ncbi:MAG: helix-turn-helix domain-containing protein [Clostridia bacterium]|nr:helix-turn-helix domain-containing protein [Clostridia bacterium]
MGEPTVQQVFGERLRLLREMQEYTQQQIADILNVSRSTYTRYENGSSAPSLELTRRLAQILCGGDPRFIMQLSTEADMPAVADVTDVDAIPIPTLSPDEKSLVLYYRTLDTDQREALLAAFRERSLAQLAADLGKS